MILYLKVKQYNLMIDKEINIGGVNSVDGESTFL